MKIHNLPNDLFSPSKSPDEDIIVYYYKGVTGTYKGRSILHRNAISLVIEGEKIMRFAEKTVHVNDTEFHFLSSGNCLASMDLSPRKSFSSVMIFFTNKVLVDFFVKYEKRIRDANKKIKITAESYVSIVKDDFIRNYINSLILLGNEASADMKRLKFEELMLHVLNAHPKKLLSFQIKEHHQLEDLQIRQAIENNVASAITVEELAFLCNMSLSTFKRKFQKLYNTSPNKYILQRRMEIAKDLLLYDREKPSEVYHKVGYENHSSFSESFKNAFGLTPKDFQSQHLNVKR